MEINVDFLYTSKYVKEKTIPTIDNTNFLELSMGITTRLDLYMYALSLGKDNPTDIDKKDNGGFVRSENLKKRVDAISMIMALAIAKKEDFESLDDILDEKKMCAYADKCANTGFKIIEKQIETLTGENSYLNMIEELDDLYNNIKK